MLCTAELSDVDCFLHYGMGLSVSILMYFVLSSSIYVECFFFLIYLFFYSFCKFWKPNKHFALEMDSDVCEFDRSHAITNIGSLLCLHYSLLGCDASLLPWWWEVAHSSKVLVLSNLHSAVPEEYSECRMCLTTKVCLLQVRVNGNEYKPSVASPNKKQAKAEAATICLQALGVLPSWIKFLMNH